MEKLMILQGKHNGRVCIWTKSNRAIIDVWENGVIEGEHDAYELSRRLCAAYNAFDEDITTDTIEKLAGYKHLTTMAKAVEEIERLKAVNTRMMEAMKDAEIQIEYLHEKFKPTGSGNKTLSLILDAISAEIKPITA